jgi:parallel beta-helix repeat protein
VDYSVIRNNRIFSNYFGIYILRGQNNILYGNGIGEHDATLGQDNGENNVWDNSISEGNYWFDYSGDGVYNLPGAIDRYPGQLMSFEPASDHVFESGLVGHSIVRSIEDPFPSTYRLYINNELNDSGLWDWIEYTIPLDDMAPGSYEITIVTENMMEMSITDSVQVIIHPSEAPDIQLKPNDMIITVGTTRALTWNAQDHSPDSYCIYLNGTVLQEGDWFGSSVSVIETWSTIASYNYTIVFTDQLGHTTSDTVIVKVTEGTTVGEPEPNYTLILSIVSMIGVVVIIVIIWKRK